MLRTDADGRLVVRRVLVRVGDGGAGTEVLLEAGTLYIGSHPACDIRLEDKSVSRHHVELSLLDRGVRVRDLESKNGTWFQGSRVESIVVPVPSEIRVGRARIELLPSDLPLPDRPSELTSFESVVGASAPMRRMYGVLARAAETDVPILIEGEEGVGKSEVAAAVHAASARRDRPFVTVDAGVLPGDGALEAIASGALGGTLVIDRIDVASRPVAEALVRMLEARERGELDVRVIATSRSDLRRAVEEGRTPRELYFHVAAVRVVVPPLRERLEDVPRLASHFAVLLGAQHGVSIDASDLGPFDAADFPGNVRQLRRMVEAAIAKRLGGGRVPRPSARPPAPAASELDELEHLPYPDAKAQIVDKFTRQYLERLIERHDGNVSRAAEEAGLGRNHLTRLLQKHGLR